jgi:hypothetical protein
MVAWVRLVDSFNRPLAQFYGYFPNYIEVQILKKSKVILILLAWIYFG